MLELGVPTYVQNWSTIKSMDMAHITALNTNIWFGNPKGPKSEWGTWTLSFCSLPKDMLFPNFKTPSHANNSTKYMPINASIYMENVDIRVQA